MIIPSVDLQSSKRYNWSGGKSWRLMPVIETHRYKVWSDWRDCSD